MASRVKAKTRSRGIVKAVLSGDTLVIMRVPSTTFEIPPEKTITLSSLMAPRLARQGRPDEPFAWQSREFLRDLCVGMEVIFQVDYISKGREFGTVCLENEFIAHLVVAEGWAKVWEVREEDRYRGEFSPHLTVLLQCQEQAKRQGVGRWNKAPGASRHSIRNLPPSAVGDPKNLDAEALVNKYKGQSLEAFVEYVRDGSTIRVYLLPGYHFVQVFVAGIQAPSMGKRVVASEKTSSEENKITSNGQKVTVSTASVIKGDPDPFGRESKHFTEIHILHRYVQIVLEGADEYSNLIGSVYYQEGEHDKDLAGLLLENGLAKFVNWSASMLSDKDKQWLKSLELEAKKSQLNMWTNYMPPPTNSRQIQDQNFTGKVVEIINGDCIVIADDSLPFASPFAEKRVNLSSIKCPRLVNDRSEAKDYLRKLLIGRQVHVSLEYSRKEKIVEGHRAPTPPAAAADRVMNFGSVFLELPSAKSKDASLAPPSDGSQNVIKNIAEMIVARGFAEVIRHQDFDVRSNHYNALLAAESRAKAAKKGMHSGKVAHVTDQTAPSKKTKDLLPIIRRKRITAVVENILSGHRYKLYIPEETCYITFSLSGVRCPGRNASYYSEAIALMRSKMMQRNVEIEVESVDSYEIFFGSLWESGSNVAVTLLESGLGTLQTSLKADRVPDFSQLVQAEKSAKWKKLKIWENYVEGQEVSNNQAIKKREKEERQVLVTEVVDGGKFYVQSSGNQEVASIQQELASLKLQEAPMINGSFNPKKGDLVLAKFSVDHSWYRAMIVNARGGAIESSEDKFEVFYMDYGNQEVVAYSQLRPLDSSISSSPGLAQLCSLAHVTVPSLQEDYGKEAAFCLCDLLNEQKEFKAIIEDADTSGGKGKGQSNGTIYMVTLVDTEAELSINAVMVKEGLARVGERWGSAERKQTIDELEKYQREAKYKRLGMWEYGDNMADDDDDDKRPPARRAGGKR